MMENNMTENKMNERKMTADIIDNITDNVTGDVVGGDMAGDISGDIAEKPLARKIMVQGTMSNSGKSFLVAGLCRILKQDGYRTAPFKSQNMALNSYITKNGLEIGRAQAMQAESAGIEPTVEMNPILLKPTSQMGSQVIVNGEVYGNLRAMDYYRRKPEFIPAVKEAFGKLEEKFDAIVIEGAGSPAEINLRDNDIVNMGLAELVDAPVILVGDIDRGGVFASLYGTVSLLEPREQARIKGLVINKFRGDKKILEPGLRMIEEKLHIPVIGVIPMEQIDLDDEDSLSDRLTRTGSEEMIKGGLDLAVIRLPHISNFTDFNALERHPGVQLRYVERASQLGNPDLILLPGTKNTISDLIWLRESGLEPAILRKTEFDRVPVIGICGGYQMLGEQLSDPNGVEGEEGRIIRGMGLLPARTVFEQRKTRGQMEVILRKNTGMFEKCDVGTRITGYEIHMGITELTGKAEPIFAKTQDNQSQTTQTVQTMVHQNWEGLEREDGLVIGTYLHGLFDNEELVSALLEKLAEKKGISLEITTESQEVYKQRQYDKLADLIRESLDMKAIYEIMGLNGEDLKCRTQN